MNAGLLFTILKPNGLTDDASDAKGIIVSHDDQGWKPTDLNYEFISRTDVAHLLTHAVLHPTNTSGLRFDVTSKKGGGIPVSDTQAVFREAMYTWDPRKRG